MRWWKGEFSTGFVGTLLRAPLTPVGSLEEFWAESASKLSKIRPPLEWPRTTQSAGRWDCAQET